MEPIQDSKEEVKGSIYAIIAGLCSIGNATLMRIVTNETRMVSLPLMLRTLVQVLLSSSALLLSRRSFVIQDKTESQFLLARCICNGLTSVLFATGVLHLPVFDAIAIYLVTITICTAFFSWYFLGELFDRITCLVLIFLILGIVLLSGPRFMPESEFSLSSFSTGSVVMILGGFFASLSIILIRKLQNTGRDLISFYASCMMFLFSLLYWSIERKYTLMMPLEAYVQTTGAGFFYVLYLFSSSLSLKFIGAIKYQIFSLVDLPLAFAVDVLYFNRKLDVITCSGAGVIILSLLAHGIRNYIRKKSKKGCSEEVQPILKSSNDAGEKSVALALPESKLVICSSATS